MARLVTFKRVVEYLKEQRMSAKEITDTGFWIFDKIKEVQETSVNRIRFASHLITHVEGYDPKDRTTAVFEPFIFSKLLLHFGYKHLVYEFILVIGELLFTLQEVYEHFGKTMPEERFTIIEPLCKYRGRFSDVHEQLKHLEPEEELKQLIDLIDGFCDLAEQR